MIALSEEDISNIVDTLYIPKIIVGKFSTRSLSFTNMHLSTPSLEVVGVYRVRKQSICNRIFRTYTYELIGLKTPLEYVPLDTFTNQAYLRIACTKEEGKVSLDKKDFKLSDFVTVKELLK